jgi:hypothetical protein
MVREFYKQFGFAIVAEDAGSTRWALAVEQYQPRPTFLRATRSLG